MCRRQSIHCYSINLSIRKAIVLPVKRVSKCYKLLFMNSRCKRHALPLAKSARAHLLRVAKLLFMPLYTLQRESALAYQSIRRNT